MTTPSFWPAFDFLEPDFDLYAFFIDLYTEQIAGYYDTETKEFFVISSNAELSEMDRLTFAHEYNHALQDQHYDLEGFNDNPLYEENYDADLALTALIEGDAQLLTIFYFSNHFTDDDMTALFAEFDTLDFPLLDSAPQIIQNDLSFPYTSGMDVRTRAL